MVAGPTCRSSDLAHGGRGEEERVWKPRRVDYCVFARCLLRLSLYTYPSSSSLDSPFVPSDSDSLRGKLPPHFVYVGGRGPHGLEWIDAGSKGMGMENGNGEWGWGWAILERVLRKVVSR